MIPITAISLEIGLSNGNPSAEGHELTSEGYFRALFGEPTVCMIGPCWGVVNRFQIEFPEVQEQPWLVTHFGLYARNPDMLLYSCPITEGATVFDGSFSALGAEQSITVPVGVAPTFPPGSFLVLGNFLSSAFDPELQSRMIS